MNYSAEHTPYQDPGAGEPFFIKTMCFSHIAICETICEMYNGHFCSCIIICTFVTRTTKFDHHTNPLTERTTLTGECLCMVQDTHMHTNSWLPLHETRQYICKQNSERYARHAASNVKKLKKTQLQTVTVLSSCFIWIFFIVSACGNITKNFIKHFPSAQYKD
jgi:hypothetical protein